MHLENKRILILGASSWLGYLLLQNLSLSNAILAGSICSNDIFLGQSVKKYTISNLITCKEALIDFEPNIVINFLRGENDEGFSIHNEIVKLIARTNGYYMYASSVLALDGYSLGTPLEESLQPKSISAYGQFKAKCELKLLASNINYSIIRFASVQGWVPHKLTRNELFLKKLQQNDKITVDKGVIQNRLSADKLIYGLRALLKRREVGVFHFGTEDHSDEIDFLRRQAKQFGYNPGLIVEGKRRDVNLVAIPNGINQILGNSYKSSEEDTLRDLLLLDGLKIYKKSI